MGQRSFWPLSSLAIRYTSSLYPSIPLFSPSPPLPLHSSPPFLSHFSYSGFWALVAVPSAVAMYPNDVPECPPRSGRHLLPFLAGGLVSFCHRLLYCLCEYPTSSSFFTPLSPSLFTCSFPPLSAFFFLNSSL